MSPEEHVRALKPVGDDDIDTLLNGGIPAGHTVLVAGESGTGKTVLSIEWLFRGHRQEGDSGLYLTLTESVTEAARNAETLSFYDADLRGASKVTFADLRTTFDIIEAEGDLDTDDIDRVVDAIRQIVDETGAERLVIDSITAIAQLLDDPYLIRTFVFRLGAMLEAAGVTTLMTSEAPEGRYSRYGVEEFISDGIIYLTSETIADQERRALRIVKMRGASYRSGNHHFAITEDGLDMFPYEQALTYPGSAIKLSTGVERLDTLLEGGFLERTTTLLSGPSGSGKTVLGLHFIRQQLEDGKRCLVVSFEESEGQLIQNTDQFGWDLDQYREDGQLQFYTVRPESVYPEQHLSHIMDLLEEDIDCVLIDSMSVIREMYPEDVFKSFARNTLFSVKAAGVTGVFTFASPEDSSPLSGQGPYVNTIADNVLSMGTVEVEGKMVHTLSIIKTRGSGHSTKIHKYTLTGSGLQIGHDMSAYRGITTGAAERIGPTVEERLEAAFIDVLGPLGEEEFARLQEKGVTRDTLTAYVDQLAEEGILDADRVQPFKERVVSILEGRRSYRPKPAEDDEHNADTSLLDRLRGRDT